MADKYIITQSGTAFEPGTADPVIQILERFMGSRSKRLRLYYGDRETGRDWGDVHDVCGYIGRSTGTIKVPLLIAKKGSYGGGSILTANIIKIRYANRKEGGVLYQQLNFHK